MFYMNMLLFYFEKLQKGLSLAKYSAIVQTGTSRDF